MEWIELSAQDGASARIYKRGAHLCSWVPAGAGQQLFMSELSKHESGVAIRGGVPIIFPQFAGMGDLPKHGFARTANWQLVRAGQIESGAAQAVFELRDNPETLQIWPHPFQAEMQFTIQASSLECRLTVSNIGASSFDFTAALHTYFAVDDISQVQISGLQGLHYQDSVLNQTNQELAEKVMIQGEVDRIYYDAMAPITLLQSKGEVKISQTGFKDAVVWNPGAQKAANLVDLDHYQTMLCIEAAAIQVPIQLEAGMRWTGSQIVELLHTPHKT